MNKIVPELYCSDVAVTMDFYVKLIGFTILYQRPAETFVYLAMDGIELMFEEANGPGRRWISGALEQPFGRGINLQIEVNDVRALYARVSEKSAASVYLPLEEKAYQCGDVLSVNRQFIVQDPDGYLLRFMQADNVT
ncbi:MAG: VOC family protein [Pseudomonadota bacterium]